MASWNLYVASTVACREREMDYGSSHVFVYADSDDEVISDVEYNEGMWLR